MGYILEHIIRKYGDMDFILIKIWLIWAIFFPKKILCIGQNHIFQVKIWLKLANETDPHQNYAKKKYHSNLASSTLNIMNKKIIQNF